MSWINKKRYEAALLALEAGIERTYQVYVKTIKRGRSNRNLTEDEKARARSLARAHMAELCQERGIDAVKVIGDEYVDLWIARIIQKRKGGA